MTDYSARLSRVDAFRRNLISAGGFLLVLATCGARGNPELRETDCSESMSCATCVNRTRCSWSLVRQTCSVGSEREELGNLSVRGETYCPRYAIDRNSFVKDVSFRRSVKVVNGTADYLSFLRKSQIRCHFGNKFFGGSVADDRIVCDPVRIPVGRTLTSRAALVHACLTVNDVQLKFDDDADYFINVGTRLCPPDKNDGQCIVCAWHGDAYRHYLKMCSAGNRCTGPEPIYGLRGVKNDTLQLGDVARVVRIGTCADVHVLSVRPRLGLLRSSGNATFMVVVKNHRILSYNRTVSVTVAGRDCADPSTAGDSDDGAINCTMPAEIDGTEPIAGPVRVTYKSGESANGYHDYEVTSAETVTFVDEPVIASFRPICGLPYGNTSLLVRGEHLDVGRTVHVTVGENVTCELITRSRDAIHCLIRPISSVGAARVRVEFDGSLSVTSPEENARFKFSNIPALYLPAGRTFGGIASGGTVVPMSGTHFDCVELARISVYWDDVIYVGGECLVKNDSYMECRSPRLNGVAEETSIEFRLSLKAFGRDMSAYPGTDNIPRYTVYPDPEFVDFETYDNGTVVVVNGRNLEAGFEVDQMVIRFRNSTVPPFTVVERTAHQILCSSTGLDHHPDSQLSVIVVTVGEAFIVEVAKKRVRDPSATSYGHSILRDTFIWEMIIVVLVVGFTATFLLIRKYKNSKTLNIRPIVELHPLDEPSKHTVQRCSQ